MTNIPFGLCNSCELFLNYAFATIFVGVFFQYIEFPKDYQYFVIVEFMNEKVVTV
jgi:hypothetical protein